MDKYRKRPSASSSDKMENKLGGWISNPQTKTRNSARNEVMAEPDVFQAWGAHKQKYYTFYASRDERWLEYCNIFSDSLDKCIKKPKT